MKLYDIVKEMEKCVDPETGEVDFERLQDLQKEKDEKLEGVALWINSLGRDISAINAETNRLNKRKAAAERKRDNLKIWLSEALAGEKFKTSLVTVGYRKSSSVVIDDIDCVPPEFVAVTTNKVADKKALKKAFDEWDMIDGCHLEEHINLQVH